MKIKSNKIIQYSTAVILASGFYMVLQNDRPVLAAEENLLNKSDQIKQLNRQLDAKKEEIKKVQVKKNKLIESLALLEEKEKNLSTLIQENTEQKQELTDSANKLADDKQGLSDQLASIKEEIAQKQSFIENKEKLLEKYEEELSTSKGNSNEGLSEQEKSDLEQLMKNQDLENKKLIQNKKQKGEELKRIKSQEANIQEFEERLLEFEKNPEENRDDISVVKAQIKTCQDLLNSLQRTVATRDRNISRSETKIKEYQAKIDTIQAKVDSNDSTNDLQKKIEDLKQNINELNLDRTDLTSKMDAISKNLDQIIKQQNSIDLHSLDNKIEALKQEHTGVLKEIGENKQSQQDIENQKAKLTSEISNLQSKIADVEKQEKLPVQKDKNGSQANVKLPGNKGLRITISSTKVDESVTKTAADVKKTQKGKVTASAIKLKKRTILIKLGKKWVKVKPKSLPKYLNNKLYKVKMTTKVKSKWGRVKLVDRKGKKTKQTIKRGKSIKVKGLRTINKHIYMYIGNGKYISINNATI